MKNVTEKILYIMLTPFLLFLIGVVFLIEIIDIFPKKENGGISDISAENIFKGENKEVFKSEAKEVEKLPPHVPYHQTNQNLRGLYVASITASTTVINTFDEFLNT